MNCLLKPKKMKTMKTNKFILGDCMDPDIGLPSYGDNHFDLAIVDPPYGSDYDAINKVDSKSQLSKRKKYHQFKNVAPDGLYFSELKRVSRNQIIWGGNFFGLSGGVIAWNKEGTAFGEGEIAICSTHKSVRFAKYRWNGMLQQDMKNKEQRIHPTQKPIGLYRWLLNNYAKEGDLILDTHVGSGSSLIACEAMGFNYVGYEIDPHYYKSTKTRMSKGIQKVLL